MSRPLSRSLSFSRSADSAEIGDISPNQDVISPHSLTSGLHLELIHKHSQSVHVKVKCVLVLCMISCVTCHTNTHKCCHRVTCTGENHTHFNPFLHKIISSSHMIRSCCYKQREHRCWDTHTHCTARGYIRPSGGFEPAADKLTSDCNVPTECNKAGVI